MRSVVSRLLTRRELNRATLARQMLLRREPATPVEAMERLVGIQAQEPQDPYHALWSRIEGFDPRDLSTAIEERRAVRVVGLMRGTIHLVSADDATYLQPLLQAVPAQQWRNSSFAKSLSGTSVPDVVAAGRELLADGPQTTAELGKRLAGRWPDFDPVALGYAVRFGVPLVQVPPRGLWQRTAPAAVDTVEHWLGRPVERDPAADAVVLRYLAAFGPATVADIRTWSSLTGLRPVVERLRPRLRTFRDERGRELFDVPDGPLPDPDTPAPVRFLPQYDNLYLSHDDRSRVTAMKFGEGWMHGPFAVDGFLAGTWEIERREDVATLRFRAFRRLRSDELDEVEAEASALLGFLAADSGERRVEPVPGPA